MPSRDSTVPRPAHRRTVSSPSAKSFSSTRATHNYIASLTNDTQHQAPLPINATNKAASRIMTSMRRSLVTPSPKKRWPEPQNYGMISTPAEHTLPTTSRYRDYDSSGSRPTIEQIAMGLHISRTPHLRPLSTSPNRYSQRNSMSAPHPHHTNLYNKSSSRSASPLALPPPPARSSLKQRGTSNTTSTRKPVTLPDHFPASASSSTVTSNNPPSSQSSISLIKSRMSRLLPRSRNASAPPSMLSSPVSSPRGSTDFQSPKKAVRFSPQVASDIEV